jgi:hypothetical protein
MAAPTALIVPVADAPAATTPAAEAAEPPAIATPMIEFSIFFEGGWLLLSLSVLLLVSLIFSLPSSF